MRAGEAIIRSVIQGPPLHLLLGKPALELAHKNARPLKTIFDHLGADDPQRRLPGVQEKKKRTAPNNLRQAIKAPTPGTSVCGALFLKWSTRFQLHSRVR